MATFIRYSLKLVGPHHCNFTLILQELICHYHHFILNNYHKALPYIIIFIKLFLPYIILLQEVYILNISSFLATQKVHATKLYKIVNLKATWSHIHGANCLVMNMESIWPNVKVNGNSTTFKKHVAL